MNVKIFLATLMRLAKIRWDHSTVSVMMDFLEMALSAKVVHSLCHL